MNVIEINNITKDYGSGKGVFDLTLDVQKGEVLGFLGPNGAGKTTTIRQLMGFVHPDKGSVSINGLDCFNKASTIAANLGYLPGEIAFMDDMTGLAFIHFIAKMKGMRDTKRAEELMRFFELDALGKIKKMSKGMKQKIGIVCAFMQDPDVLVLDEPTSGLDPLMQSKFIELIIAEKAKGKTILMSSHIFEEIEKTCDRAAIIREGRLVSIESMESLRRNKRKNFVLRFVNADEAAKFAVAHGVKVSESVPTEVKLSVKSGVDALIKELAAYEMHDIDITTPSLEELFMHYYGGEDNV